MTNHDKDIYENRYDRLGASIFMTTARIPIHPRESYWNKISPNNPINFDAKPEPKWHVAGYIIPSIILLSQGKDKGYNQVSASYAAYQH